jgi:ferrochelatase
MSRVKTAVVLIGHGTVDNLDDLPAFLRAIRRGHAPSPELLSEVRRRYEAIGGRSPLLAICREVAEKLELRLGLPVRIAMRLWAPYPKDVLRGLLDEGIEHVAVVPLAQHSARIYGESVEAAARELAQEGRPSVIVRSAQNWGQEPLLTHAFADEIRRSLARISEAHRSETLLLYTAHSLPLSVVRSGDPYEGELRRSARAISDELGSDAPPSEVAFQSQGLGGGEWLGPDLPTSFDAARVSGKKHVLLAPIGFLADHVEILYDLDLEAQSFAKERGLTLARTQSLNASDGMIDALERVARPLLE